MSRRSSLAALVAGAALAATGLAASAVGAYERAIMLEQQGRLAKASEVLARADELSKSKQAHAAALRQALRSVKAASVYRQNGQLETAREVLAAAIAQVDPVRDVWISLELGRQLANLNASMRSDIDTEITEMLKRAEGLEDDQEYEQAAAAYATALERAGEDASPALLLQASIGRARAEREAEEAADELRSDLDAEITEMLKRAEGLEDDQEYEQAAAAYATALERAGEDASRALLLQVSIGRARAEREAEEAADERGLADDAVDWAGDKGRAAFGWVDDALPILVLVGLVLIWTQLPPLLQRREGNTSVSLTDSSGDGAERGRRGVALSRELVAEIHALAQGPGPGETEIDETRDRDGTSIPSLAVADDQISKLDAVVTDDSAIRLGPVSFSLRQALWLLSSPLRRRSQFELDGSFTSQGKRSLLRIGLYDRKKHKEPSSSWHVVAEGDDSRERVLVEAAARIAVEIGESYVSDDWRSVLEYRAGQERIRARAPTSDPELSKAEECLQRAVGSDPHNLLARFYLASVLRSRGDNEEAVRQLRFLRDLLGASSALRPSARRFLERHPEFELVIRYNLAAALSKHSDWKAFQEAIEILKLLEASLGDRKGEGLEDEDRLRLHMLVRGAYASALVFQLEEWREHKQTPELEKRRRETIAQIRGVREALTEPPADVSPGTRVGHIQARATAENAYGRALYVTNDESDRAREAFETAVSLIPDFPDAWVNLASHLVERKRPADWARRAEEALDRADALSPQNSKAKYLRGRLYENTGRLDEAKQSYRAAGLDYRTYAAMARVSAGLKDFESAVTEMRESLKLRDRVDARAGSLAESLLKLANSKGNDQRHLDEADAWAARLEDKGQTDSLRRWGSRIRERVQDLRPIP